MSDRSTPGRGIQWPFLSVTDAAGRDVGWAAVNGPIVTHAQHRQLADLSAAGYRFVGVSSYLAFPRDTDGDARDYAALCEAWCHCFRDPDSYLPSHLPRALISLSDFTDPRRVSPGAIRAAVSRVYDFVYAGAAEPWKQEAKNWSLAEQCLPLLCRDLGLVGLAVGAPPCDPGLSPWLTVAPALPWAEFLAHLAGARFLFVPNARDPSPRVLAEALCLDVPVVVNRHILGGWKYVNAFTGAFFESATDVVAAVRKCLDRPHAARAWFSANHGPYRAGTRLLHLLGTVDPDLPERSHLGFTPNRH